MQANESIFNIHESPFKAESADAMEFSILGFCKAKMSEYDFLTYYYVSCVKDMPEKLLDLELPFHSAYEMAKGIWERKNQ